MDTEFQINKEMLLTCFRSGSRDFLDTQIFRAVCVLSAAPSDHVQRDAFHISRRGKKREAISALALCVVLAVACSSPELH